MIVRKQSLEFIFVSRIKSQVFIVPRESFTARGGQQNEAPGWLPFVDKQIAPLPGEEFSRE